MQDNNMVVRRFIILILTNVKDSYRFRFIV